MTQTATPEDTGALLSPAAVARLAAISRKTVYREIGRGELPAIPVGRQLRIDKGGDRIVPGAFTRLLRSGA
jgi:excisionase family DNA binding protein